MYIYIYIYLYAHTHIYTHIITNTHYYKTDIFRAPTKLPAKLPPVVVLLLLLLLLLMIIIIILIMIIIIVIVIIPAEDRIKTSGDHPGYDRLYCHFRTWNVCN